MVYVELAEEPAAALVARSADMSDPALTDRVREHIRLSRRAHKRIHDELSQLGGVVVADLVRVANAVQADVPARAIGRILALPGVKGVHPVPTYSRSTASASGLIGAPQMWGTAETGLTGKGVRVAIIDTGIDYLHADLGGVGDPAQYESNDRALVEPGTFPTTKVIGGWDFVGDAYNGENNAQPDADPLDCATVQGTNISGGHGTHVAGIVAGNGVLSDGTAYPGPYLASFDPLMFRIGPGMAPEASLYALKVFGCEGGTNMVASALEWAADPNDDGDLSDRVDVVNMSLGSSYAIATPVDKKQVENLTKLGTLVVVAAGNDGDVFFAAGSPATYTESVAIAATTDSQTFLGMEVLSPASVQGDYACVEGFFTKPLATAGTVEGQVVATSPADACSTLTNASALQGKIALINRGKCTFVSKVQEAQDAGALAVVMVDNADADVPFAMGGDGGTLGIPGVMITKVSGAKLAPQLGNNVTVRLDPKHIYPQGVGADHMASFSSRGPRATDWLLKPDVAAPGVGIDSAGVASGNSPRQMSGTSMACPVAAGGAALLRQAAPGLGPLEIKAQMMNGAEPLFDAAGHPTPVSLGGSGRLALVHSASLKMTAAAESPSGAVSLSFGSIVTDVATSATRTLVITNHSDKARDVDVKVAPSYALEGVLVQPEKTAVQVPASSTVSVSIRIDVDPQKLPPAATDAHTAPVVWEYTRHFLVEAAGHVIVTDVNDPAMVLRVPYHSSIRPGSNRHAGAASKCAGAADGSVAIPIEGSSAHPDPVTSAFEVLATSTEGDAKDPAADILALGVATNLATKTPYEDASIYFGVAVAGTWPTIARGPLSMLGVAIDVDGDDEPDFAVQAAPLSNSGPFLDVLAAVLYNVKTGETAGSPRFLNIVPRDQRDTEPFDNGVIVFPVTIGSLGLTQGKSEIGAFAYSYGGDALAMLDDTKIARWNPEKRLIDTTTALFQDRYLPFHGPAEPVRVNVDWDAKGDTPLPSVMLMHHTNVPGQRLDIVKLDEAGIVQPANLRVATSVEGPADGSTQVVITAKVTNDSDQTARAAKLAWVPKIAAKVVAMTTSQGSCQSTGTAQCTLGDLKPKGTASVDIVVDLGTGGVSGTVQVTTEDGCDTNPADNSAMVAMGGLSTPEPQPDGGTPATASPIDEAYAGGGACACGTTNRGSSRWWMVSGLLAALTVFRARRRAA